MILVKNNKTEDLNRAQFAEIVANYEKVILDIGTGDGRFVYKKAVENPQNLYVGVDPSRYQMREYSKKAVTNKVDNCMFIVGSIEVFPEELYGMIDNIFIILPWGSLLSEIVKVNKISFEKINNMFKNSGYLEIIFGYSQEAESSEVKRLGLDKLNTNYIYSKMIPKLMEYGFQVGCVTELTKDDLFNVDSSWSKRLTFGSDRPLYSLKLSH